MWKNSWRTSFRLAVNTLKIRTVLCFLVCRQTWKFTSPNVSDLQSCVGNGAVIHPSGNIVSLFVLDTFLKWFLPTVFWILSQSCDKDVHVSYKIKYEHFCRYNSSDFSLKEPALTIGHKITEINDNISTNCRRQKSQIMK